MLFLIILISSFCDLWAALPAIVVGSCLLFVIFCDFIELKVAICFNIFNN